MCSIVKLNWCERHCVVCLNIYYLALKEYANPSLDRPPQKKKCAIYLRI